MKIGCVVRKRIGGFMGIPMKPTGPYMLTVKNFSGDMVECCWTEEEGTVKYRKFHEDTLQVYELDD